MYVCESLVYLVSTEAPKVHQNWSYIIHGCKLLHGCWELNLCPFQNQSVFVLTVELSLHPLPLETNRSFTVAQFGLKLQQFSYTGFLNAELIAVTQNTPGLSLNAWITSVNHNTSGLFTNARITGVNHSTPGLVTNAGIAGVNHRSFWEVLCGHELMPHKKMRGFKDIQVKIRKTKLKILRFNFSKI